MTDAAASKKRSTEMTDVAVPRSVGRVLDLLEIVLANRNCNLTFAAAACGLTPTTARRHLRALEARGYVHRDAAGDFSAGSAILRIAASLRDEGPLDRLVSTAQPHLDQLAEATGESTYLAVSDGRTGTYLAAAESQRAIRHVGWVGQDVALEGTALGAALVSPGVTVLRTGAVEPDISAVCRALPVAGKLAIALSVIGPEHRFGAEALTAHRTELEATVSRLACDLGIATSERAS